MVRFGETEAPLCLASSNRLIARVPENVTARHDSGGNAQNESQPFPVSLGVQIADNLHPVANPAVDAHGNIYVTFSGPRGQRVPVSLYKIASELRGETLRDFADQSFGAWRSMPKGDLFVSCRHDGTIHRVTPDGQAEQWIEGMGIATGLAFDRSGILFVGDRSGTIFKISPYAGNFRFRHAGAFGGRIPPGVSSQRRTLCHRADDFEL